MSSVEEITNTILREAASAAKVGMARSSGTLYAHLHARIAAALAAERAKFAAFADENGEPRKVLGTLPVTADGAFAGIGGKVFTAWWHEFPKELGGRRKLVGEWTWWYSLQQENICEKIATTAYTAATSALDAAKEQP